MNRDDDFKDGIARPPTRGQRRTDQAKSRVQKGRNHVSPLPLVSNPVGEHSGARPSIIVPLPEPPPPPGPSYPAWERPLSRHNFPQLRGQEQHRPWWPLIAAVLAVFVVLSILVIIPTLAGHPVSVSAASASASASAAVHASNSGKPGPSLSGHPSGSLTPSGAKPSVSATPTQSGPLPSPTPAISFQQYQVVAGDTLIRIAVKFGLKTWELKLANPSLPASGAVRVGQWLNIPQPGQLTPPPA
jgi:LysM repeat protein